MQHSKYLLIFNIFFPIFIKYSLTNLMQFSAYSFPDIAFIKEKSGTIEFIAVLCKVKILPKSS